MIERELTFLAATLPEGLLDCSNKQITDLYVENGTNHADLRIRQNGDRHEITRKQPVAEGDASTQTEVTIPINATEFASFANTTAKRISKRRYYYNYDGQTAEFDVFEDALDGLVVVDFEFETDAAKAAFVMPDFCLTDITQEKFIAGGVLAGKSYEDITFELDRFGYQAIR